jgi:hypothetical protein
MSASNLFVLGLLLLTANLSLCALFAPSRSGNGAAERLVQLWKLLFLAMVEVGAWAVVLHQGGAAPTLQETFTRCAACFALAGGADGGLAPPWGELKSFMALNGLLFIPVALIPWMSAGASREQVANTTEEPLQIPDDPLLHDLLRPRETSAPSDARPTADHLHAPASNSVPATEAAQKPSDAALTTSEGGHAMPGAAEVHGVQPPPLPPPGPSTVNREGTPPPEQKPFGFRPSIPKVQAKVDAESPEAQLAEQMKPVGPTPPPIRFRWNDGIR